jgi:hypothetical protein
MTSNGNTAGINKEYTPLNFQHQIEGRTKKTRCTLFLIYFPVIVSITILAFTGVSYYIVLHLTDLSHPKNPCIPYRHNPSRVLVE